MGNQAEVVMPRFPEQRLWDRIHKNVGLHVHIERIENSVGAGTPDTLVIHKGNVLFVEHKEAERPAKASTRLQWRHPLTPQQRNWHLTWHQNGGRSAIVIGVERELFALPGRMADDITAMPYNVMAAWRLDYIALTNVYQGLVRL